MKNVILFTVDKGGVGKSFTSRLFADYFCKKGIEAKLSPLEPNRLLMSQYDVCRARLWE